MSAFLLKNPDCVLIHIPKSAGTSIRLGVWKGNYEGPFFGTLPTNLEAYFKFAFVRNPYDRLVSIWRMFSIGTSRTRNKKLKWKPDPKLTICDILKITKDDIITHDRSLGSFKEKIKHHSIPMTHAFNALHEANFIGRFENLNDDWRIICRNIGMKFEPLPHHNWSMGARGDYRDYFDHDLRTLVEEVYSEDLRQFEYEF